MFTNLLFNHRRRHFPIFKTSGRILTIIFFLVIYAPQIYVANIVGSYIFSHGNLLFNQVNVLVIGWVVLNFMLHHTHADWAYKIYPIVHTINSILKPIWFWFRHPFFSYKYVFKLLLNH